MVFRADTDYSALEDEDIYTSIRSLHDEAASLLALRPAIGHTEISHSRPTSLVYMAKIAKGQGLWPLPSAKPECPASFC